MVAGRLEARLSIRELLPPRKGSAMNVVRSCAVRVALAVLWIGGDGLLSAEEIEVAGTKVNGVGPVFVAQPRLQPDWGTQDLGVRTIHGTGFQPLDSTSTYSFNSITTHRFRTSGNFFFDAVLPDLPAGALFSGLEIEACDDNASLGVTATLFRRTSPAGPNGTVGSVSTGDPEIPGCGFFGVTNNLIGTGEVVDNFNRIYWIRVTLPATDDSTSLGAVRVYYQLQVSSAPAVATFGDVPTTHLFFRFIEALAASGITAGCGSGNFCPDSPLTRGQMAVFLSIALGLHFPY